MAGPEKQPGPLGLCPGPTLRIREKRKEETHLKHHSCTLQISKKMAPSTLLLDKSFPRFHHFPILTKRMMGETKERERGRPSSGGLLYFLTIFNVLVALCASFNDVLLPSRVSSSR